MAITCLSRHGNGAIFQVSRTRVHCVCVRSEDVWNHATQQRHTTIASELDNDGQFTGRSIEFATSSHVEAIRQLFNLRPDEPVFFNV